MPVLKNKLKTANLKSRNVVICRCEDVTEEEIVLAIRKGADTFEAVKKMTRAGMGNCQSRSCYQHIARILSRETGKPLEEIMYASVRPPEKPLPIKLFCKDNIK